MLAITWSQAVISCRVNCCRRPVFPFLASLLTAAVLRPPERRHLRRQGLRILFLQHRHRRLANADSPSSSRLRCRRFSMSDVYIGRTLIGNICILSTTTQTPFITNYLVTIVHTKPVNSNFSPKIGWHGNNPLTLNLGYVFIGQLDPKNPPLESNCVSLAIIQPKSAHQTPKPVIANCVPNWLLWQRPSAPMDPHPTHDSNDPSEPTTQTASLSVQPSLHRRR